MQDGKADSEDPRVADLALVAWLCVVTAAWLWQFVKPGLALLSRIVAR